MKKQHYYLRLLKGIRTLVKLKVKVKLKEHIEITSRGKLVLVIYVYFIALFWIVHHIWCWSFFPSGTFVSRPRNSHPEVFCKKVVLRNFPKFTGKHLCQSLSFNKVAGEFLRILQIFQEHLFYRASPGNCFCNLLLFYFVILDCSLYLRLEFVPKRNFCFQTERFQIFWGI